MSKPRPRVHVQDSRYKTRALCGLEWDRAHGGRVASDTTPPVVCDDESGSVNPATCQQCILAYRRRLASPQR